MTQIAIFILLSWGFTHLIVSSKVFESVRNQLAIKSSLWESLLSCYQCSGFWVGMGLAVSPLLLPELSQSNFIDYFFYAVIASGTCPLIYGVLRGMGLISDKYK